MKKNLKKINKFKNNKKIIMKTLFFNLLLFVSITIFGQTAKEIQTISNLPIVKMGRNVNLHIISPEPIQYVDLSSNTLIGDLPENNIARIKINENPIDTLSIKKLEKVHFNLGDDIGVITVVGQSFIAQYRAVYTDNPYNSTITNVQIQPEEMQPIEIPKMELSKLELSKLSLDIIRKNQKTSPINRVKNLKLTMDLNNVYVLGNYIFLDITVENKTNLSYNIDGIKFSLEDKKVYKATNNQSLPLEPLFQYQNQKEFKKKYHNIYVFKKISFPNSKVLMIRLFEEQVSGRTIEMKIKYSDILNADTF